MKIPVNIIVDKAEHPYGAIFLGDELVDCVRSMTIHLGAMCQPVAEAHLLSDRMEIKAEAYVGEVAMEEVLCEFYTFFGGVKYRLVNDQMCNITSKTGEFDTQFVGDENLHKLIAGAIFDFAGYLTGQHDSFRVGSDQPAGLMVKHIEAWAKTRNLQIEEARVGEWNDALEPKA